MGKIKFWVHSIESVFSLSALKQSFCVQDGRLEFIRASLPSFQTADQKIGVSR